ncbi:AIPR family protein [Agilicoccus flavus]|uniref:AIPR family protein n=1 Tax=Agilicoccus flavus TaxID=2775968 RepID=UPI001CF623EC|nr:AIPR family protein [Agilicoccus flavus]
MHILTQKRVEKFARDLGLSDPLDEQFEYYVAATYLFRYVKNSVELLQSVVLGGGEDEGIDVGAVIVNGQIVMDPSDIDELITGQEANSAKVVFLQAKTSEKFDSKLMSKFLHGVESVTQYAMRPGSIALPPRLVDLALLIERIAENGDKFQDTKIPCELYYVTSSAGDGREATAQLQVSQAMARITNLGVYPDTLRLRAQGHEDLAAKQKEKLGPQNVQFNFEKRQTIPDAAGVSEAYIGLISGDQLLRLLKDEGEVRPGIFDDNVRLHLGYDNPVNRRIYETLESANRQQFPFLNNGITLIATKLQGNGDRFFISGYQIVNGGQTSYQVIRWAGSEAVAAEPSLLSSLWVPIKIISSSDPDVRSRVAVATNLQSAIGNVDIQASLKMAKNVEEFFAQTGAEGLRYERQGRGASIDFPRTRVLGTTELNRAVAATIFGESSRAIASPKDLESEESFVWGSAYPVEMYYYAAWIVYRIERLFGRSQDRAVLKAAKYHLAMMVSACTFPELVPYFEQESPRRLQEALAKMKIFQGSDRDGRTQQAIEEAIGLAVELSLNEFQPVLAEGRSLRKDDVRSRRIQEVLLKKMADASRR